MHELKKEQISSWKKQKGGYHDSYFPGAINSNCPYCGSLVSYSFTHWHKALHGLAVGKTSCPSCAETVRFLLLDYEPTSQEFDDDTSLWVYPPLQVQQALPGMERAEELDDKLTSAYKSTVNVFNSGEWNATAILVRRFLDGLMKNNLGHKHMDQELEEQLEALVKASDLTRPITQLTETVASPAVKKIFDLDIEPDKACAELMIDFTNLLIEYLYIIPMRAEELHKKSRALQLDADEQNEKGNVENLVTDHNVVGKAATA